MIARPAIMVARAAPAMYLLLFPILVQLRCFGTSEVCRDRPRLLKRWRGVGVERGRIAVSPSQRGFLTKWGAAKLTQRNQI